MTKVLALLTLAVLAFSVMTGPAFAQVGPRMVLRRIAPVEHMTRRPPVVDRELGRVFGLGDRDLDLRKPGGRDAWKSDLGRDAKSDVDLLDNGGSKRF